MTPRPPEGSRRVGPADSKLEPGCPALFVQWGEGYGTVLPSYFCMPLAQPFG